MINVASKLNYKIKFCDLNYKTGSMNVREVKKKISKNTSAIVLTNMFNDYKNSREIKNLAKKYQIITITKIQFLLELIILLKKKKILRSV